MITGGQREIQEERKGRKHRRQRRSTSSKSLNENEAKRSGLIRAVEGMANGLGNEGQSSLKGQKDMGMQKVGHQVWWKTVC